MPFSPLRPTVAQWCTLAAAMAGFAYLLLDLAGQRVVPRTVPDGHGSTLEYLETGGEKLTVDEVAAQPNSRWHAWATAGFPPNRKRDQALWARVRLQNPGPEMLHGVLVDAEHFTDRTECFRRSDSAAGSWIRMRSGEWTAPREKAVWGRENAFPVTVPPRGEQTLYLRYEDFFGVWLSVNWWPAQEQFHAAQLRATLAEGLYFGILLALLFYNAMLWMRLRLAPTGSYLLHLGSFTLFMFFARSTPQLLGCAIGSPWMEALLTTFLALSGAFLLTFAEVFLELSRYLPGAMRWLRRLRVVMVAMALGSLLSPWLGLTTALSFPVLGCVLAHVVVFGTAIAARRAGAAQASYFMLAIGVLFAGCGPAIPVWLNLLSISDVSRIVMVGSAMEMLLLAIIMSDRLGLLQQEKIAAQGALLREAEQRETLQEAYADDLALEVRERTAELEAANADKDRILAVLGHDLRSPLTGLTRSAEHWSMRTTGDPGLQTFMVEAVQTGRGLLLLIEDLVMWARLRAGARHAAVHPLGALASPVLALHQFQATAAGIALEIRVPDNLPVKTDLVPVQALLRNLLGNALRAARHVVRVEAVSLSGRVQISVRDDGAGLPSALAAAISSGDPGQLPNIHGLGLRLCLEISRALALDLSVASSPEGGTEFQFFLPAS